MTKEFLPKTYEIPTGPSHYMQFEEGANKLRILGSAITGWEWWTDDEKGGRVPNRVEQQDQIAKDALKVKHFWAFPVWNYKTKEVQILEVTQKTIMRGIQLLMDAWGHPTEYDMVIGKTKVGPRDMDVEYSVMPGPDGKQPLDEGTLKYYQDLNINLAALYSNEDPFGEETKEKADGRVWEKEVADKTVFLASQKQLSMIFSLAAHNGYAPGLIKDGLKKLYKLESFNDLTSKQASQIIDNYVRAFKAADKAMNFDRVPEEKTEDEKALEEEPMPEWMEQ